MKKRLISLLLVFSMVFSLIPTTAFAVENQQETSVELENPFKDVNETDWFYDAVQYARINSFFSGVTKNTFNPNGTMTRGMFVTVLARMAGVDGAQYKGRSAFEDVPENAYYAPYVTWAVKYGITAGTGAGRFSPNMLINREQMATFFVAYFEKFGVDYDTGANLTTKPGDLGKISSWAKDAVLKLWKQGLLVGDGKYFNPSGNASRAQAAALCRSADNAVKIWYKEPGVPSERVRIDPVTGLPFEPDPPAVVMYTVTYTDGVPGEEIFADQVRSAEAGSATPEFIGTPAREGYTFAGWNPEVAETVTGNVTYTAQWTEEIVPPDLCMVTYTDGVSGEVVFEDQRYAVVKGGVTPGFAGIPTREGYTFAGWNPEVTDTVTGNVTYTAQWESITPEPAVYTVTYTDGVSDEEVFADQVSSVEEGSATPEFEGTPAREGYNFIGWNPEVTETVTGSVTYTAQWEAAVPNPVMYTVTYTDGVADEEVFADQVSSVEEGSATPEFEGTPARKGYTFAGWEPEVTQTVTGSVTYTAQWEADAVAPANYAVKFYDGNRLIDTLYTEKDQPLGAVPSVEKSSKANAILVGYYLDRGFTKPFYAESPVTGNISVYAKYEEMGSEERITLTSFAQMDQKPDLRFEISGSGNPEQAVTLEVMDGSDPVELAFTRTSEGYIVYAPEGFNEGCSYQLTLADGWTFTGKPDSIRTASFSIAMKEVENLQMNDDIVYIKDTDDINYSVGGRTYEELTNDLVSEVGGSFNYDGRGLAVGDTLCIYVGKHPDDRDNGGDTLLPVVYVKVSSVSGNTVTFAQMTAEEQLDLYEVPDNFPILVTVLPSAGTGTVNIAGLDKEMYLTMMGEGHDLSKARESIGAGDFVTLYVSQDGIQSESDLYYAQITAYDAATGEITYKKVDKQAILDSMDLYSNVDLESADYISAEEKAAIEAAVLADVSQSGFAEDAAFMLADMITKTDAFRSTRGIQDLIVTDDQGNKLTADQIEMLNIGGSFELTDDVELTVELITNKDQLRYGSGVRIAVGVEAEFEVELESEDKININLSATFVEEVALDPRVKGSLVYKEILWIPVPIGVSVGATVDIRNFTAFSFEAEILTIPADDPDLFTQFTDMVKNPEKLADFPGLPDEFSEGLKTVGDVFDKIEELQTEISKAVDTAEENSAKVLGYAEDVANLWEFLETNDLGDKETYKELCEQLNKTSITSDLLGLLNLEPIEEGELNTEYYESLEALLERYCEMLEQETDWITLVEEEMGKVEACVYGIAIGVEFTFLVHADMSLAIGSNLEYEVGKRYEFWFKIGLFKPSAGSTTMDLLDEHFAYQFYIMGRLGLRVGVKALVYVGIGTGDVAQVGITIELGPYMKMYGFFIYEYEKHRPANTSQWISNERMAGSIFMEFGLYFIMGFEASAAADLFSYSCDFFDVEIPLVSVGDEKYYYQPDYAPAEDEMVLIKDVDGNSNTGITMTLPDYMLALKYLHMTEGYLAIGYLDYGDFVYTLSNPNFSIDSKTGEISVTVPEDTRYMECDLTITYKYGKLSFSTYDMTITVPLVWTNLSTAELSEYYTASVRVGNNTDGYVTVWSQRVLKNKEFDLPTVDQIKEIIGWNEYKHVMGSGYGSQKLEGLTLIEDEVYDFNIDYRTYSVTVSGVQNSNGSTVRKTFYAGFGEKFDFSSLEGTGTTDYSKNVFTKFKDLTIPDSVDLSKAIDTRTAAALEKGVSITANYADNSVTATFTFTGIDADDVTIKLRRGDTPELDAVDQVVFDQGMAIVDIFPAVGPMNGSTSYQVVCGQLDTAPATLTFEENGGSQVEDITKPYGSLIGVLPTPERTGYTFGGWYADKALTKSFELTKMPEGGTTAYAKWTANQYTVTFHVNGGNGLEESQGSKTVSFGEVYGTLPEATRTGYSFAGWFTAAEGGEQITAESIYNLTENQTLYAHWIALVEIDAGAFDFGDAETFFYKQNVSRDAAYTVSTDVEALDGFTFEYICEGYEDEGYVAHPVNAGIWGVKVTRPADETYAKFEAFYDTVLIIEKATRKLIYLSVDVEETGFIYGNVKLADLTEIEDADENLQISFSAMGDTDIVSTSMPTDPDETHMLTGMTPGNTYTIAVYLTGERNYEDCIAHGMKDSASATIKTKSAPSGNWTRDGNYDTAWYDESATEYIIDTSAELAGLAYLSREKDVTFSGKTIKLGADIDMSAHQWDRPIGDEWEAFAGVFDGQGHTVSGLYISTSQDGAGLFGAIEGTNTSRAYVKNLVLDDSYIKGTGDYVGGIVGYLIDWAQVQNCVNYAYVTGNDGAGGIVGKINYATWSYIMDCVNYGTVTSSTSTGGILGGSLSDSTGVMNNVNFGSVSGDSAYGIGYVPVNGRLENNYNVGRIVSTSTLSYPVAGAAISLSAGKYTTYNYYLAGCATFNGEVMNAYTNRDYYKMADGTTDSYGSHYASSFTSPDSKLLPTAGDYAGMTLIEALNAYADTNKLTAWEATGPNGYPQPVGSPVSALRK